MVTPPAEPGPLSEAGRTRQRHYIVALLAGGVCISFAPIFTRFAMDGGGVGPTAAAFWRMAFATPVLMLLWWPRLAAGSRRMPPIRICGILALPGLLFAADLATWHASLRFTTVAHSTLLANCAVIVVSLVGWLWFRERLTWMFVLGAALALSGVGVVLELDLEARSAAFKGDLLALLTALCYGAYLVCIKILRRRHDVLQVMAVSSLVCAMLLLPGAMALREQLLSSTWQGWLALVGLALVSHCGGQSLIALSLAHLPASFSAVTLLIQPLGSALWGWLMLGEAVGPWQGFGALCVLAGIVLARRGSR